ncbi:MAG: hypothetical protein SchgKO_21910 [Schleiferiaceae bacterium]
MRQVLTALFFLWALLGFSQEEYKEYHGTWVLTQVYSDPGDGSGEFYDVESDKIITIDSELKIESNADLCRIYGKVGESTSGQLVSEDGVLKLKSCSDGFQQVYFECKGDVLIMRYICKEGCAEKYVRR